MNIVTSMLLKMASGSLTQWHYFILFQVGDLFYIYPTAVFEDRVIQELMVISMFSAKLVA